MIRSMAMRPRWETSTRWPRGAEGPHDGVEQPEGAADDHDADHGRHHQLDQGEAALRSEAASRCAPAGSGQAPTLEEPLEGIVSSLAAAFTSVPAESWFTIVFSTLRSVGRLSSAQTTYDP